MFHTGIDHFLLVLFLASGGGEQKGAYQPKYSIIPLLGFLFLLNEIPTTTVVSTPFCYGRSRVLSDAVQLS